MALPTVPVPASGPSSGDFLSAASGYIGDTALVVVLGISVVGLLAAAWAGLATLDAARRTKPTMNWKRGMSLGLFANMRTPNRGMTPWAMVGLIGIVVAGLLLFVMYLLNEAVNVI